MSEQMGADELVDVAGYVACRCGQWLIDPGERSSIRLCPDCRGALNKRSVEGRLRYEVEGRTFTAKPRPRKKPKPRPSRKKQRLTDEQLDRRRRTDRAKMRAMVRLARIYRAMYEVVLAEEKIREGLDPTVGSAIPRPRAIEAEILRDLADAEERDAYRGQRLRSGT